MHPAPLTLIRGNTPSPPGAAHTVEDLFNLYARYVARVAMRLLGRDDDVDDIVQEVFLAAWKGLSELREPEAVKGWLATVTVRRVARRLRLRKLRVFVRLEDAPDYGPLVVHAGQERAALLTKVYETLDALPVDLRIPWTLQKLEGDPLDRIAVSCECSLATVKRRIAAAQTKIDEVMADA